MLGNISKRYKSQTKKNGKKWAIKGFAKINLI